LGLRALSLNAETLQLAAKNGRNVIDEIGCCLWEIVFLFAERLSSPEINKLIRDDRFRRNIILLGIDEAHLLVPWGKECRKAYHQIPLLRARLPGHTNPVLSCFLKPQEFQEESRR